MSVNVCHISTVHSAFDDRIFYKECVSLSKAGYNVTLVINHDKDERVKGVNIKALKKSESRLTRFLFKPFQAILKALSVKAKIIHFHDPELIPLGLFFSILGKKVIYDAHENVPSQILSKTYIRPFFFRKLIAKLIRIFEHFGVYFFDAVISVIPEITNRFPKNKRVLIRNLPIVNLLNNGRSLVKKPTEKTILFYAGGLSEIRGIIEVLKAIENIDDIELWLIGQWSSDNYRKLCQNHQSWSKVKYFGFMKLEEVFSYLTIADIGLCILYPEPNYLKSLPVKAFEYMAFQKPMIMSNFPYWQKVYNNCAVFVDPFNINQIREAIINLKLNKANALKMGEVGKELVLSKYSWEAEEEKLISLYKNILS